MRKGVTLRVQVYIEGDDAPADDFAQRGKELIAQMFAEGSKRFSGAYSITVQQVEALEGSDAEDQPSDGSKAVPTDGGTVVV